MKNCVVPENIHTPSPYGGPLPEFPNQGVLVRPPPRNFRNFPTWLGTPRERIVTSKMLLHYTIMQRLIVSAIKRENILLFMLVQCLIISILPCKGRY